MKRLQLSRLMPSLFGRMKYEILISPFFFILNIRNIMKYEVIKGRIDGKVAGEVVELEQEVAESYGEEYVKLIEE